MTRRPLALALLGAALMSAPAGAQGILDLAPGGGRGILDLLGGGDSKPARAPRPARDVPRSGGEAKKQTAAPAKNKKPGKTDAAPATAAKTTTTPDGAAPAPPYQAQLVRLSELMGSLAFLRDLCPEKDGGEWRDRMSALLEAEAPNGPRRNAYTAAFNRGFHSYELTYRVCTENAKVASVRFLDEAAKISKDVSYRYGSP
jgi:uncharacterized protein (TIGR02301 family)